MVKAIKKVLTNKNFQFVILIFVIWRLSLQLFFILENPHLWPWANFDGSHYLSIAQYGYGQDQQAIFPLYPKLINILTFNKGTSLYPYLISGLFISNISFILALYVFLKLIKIDFEEKIAKRAIIFLLIFPLSFIFTGVYAESIFLLFILCSFYFARRNQWWLAGIFGALSSATSITGIFIFPALLYEWFEQRQDNKSTQTSKSIFTVLPILLVPLGLISCMRYLFSQYQDPLMFRVPDKIILPYQVYWRYFKMILSTKLDPLYFTVWLELSSATAFTILLIISYLKKIRRSYLIFAVLSFVLPTLNGTFTSMPRYVLVLFPCFIGLSLIENKIFRISWLIINLILLLIVTIFFTRGYFVA